MLSAGTANLIRSSERRMPSGWGEVGRSTTAFPSPENPSSSLTTARRRPGRIRCSSPRAFSTSVPVRTSSNPAGIGTSASRNTFRLPDLVPRWHSAGSSPFIGMPSSTESVRSTGVPLKTVR